MSAALTAEQVAELLNEIYALYDELCEQHGLRRIDIIGDAYLAVAGCPVKGDRVENSVRAVRMAQAMIDVTRLYKSKSGINIRIRVGLHRRVYGRFSSWLLLLQLALTLFDHPDAAVQWSRLSSVDPSTQSSLSLATPSTQPLACSPTHSPCECMSARTLPT